ncbi:MAG: hypothetical protein ACLT98_00720 [Eggerthellaceae bacterium]
MEPRLPHRPLLHETLLADHLDRGILLQDMPRLALSADTVADVQDALAKAVRAYAAMRLRSTAPTRISRGACAGGGRRRRQGLGGLRARGRVTARDDGLSRHSPRGPPSASRMPETGPWQSTGRHRVGPRRRCGGQRAPNRAWARGGDRNRPRRLPVIATDGDGEVVDLPKWAVEAPRRASPTPQRPFQGVRRVHEGSSARPRRAIEQAGRTPSDIAALASQLAAKPGDDGGAGGKRI